MTVIRGIIGVVPVGLVRASATGLASAAFVVGSVSSDPTFGLDVVGFALENGEPAVHYKASRADLDLEQKKEGDSEESD